MKPLGQIIKLPVNPVTLPLGRFFTEVMITRNAGKIRKHTPVSATGTVSRLTIEVHVIANGKTVTGRADQVTGTTGHTFLCVFFPHI